MPPRADSTIADTRSAEQQIDAAIVRAPTSRVRIDLAEAGIDAAAVTPELMGRYHTAGWRIVALENGILTLSN